MNIVFRVDASSHMGIGHFTRCLTLAETLRQRGADVRFVCRAHAGHMIAVLTHAAIPVTVLPTPITTPDFTEDYAAWLGVTQEVDAAETIEALNGECPDWLIVDHYGLDEQWERILRPHIGKLLVIDDLANRPHDCDVLLDQNYSTNAETRYQCLVPAACRCLLGPRYALLRPEYAANRKSVTLPEGQVRRILVFFGGADPANVTGMALEALAAPELQELQVDVVVGASNSHRKAIERQVEQRPFTSLYEPRPHLADLMAQADLALGAGGATTWERLCLGLPSLVVSIAENQVPACKSLATSEFIEYLGPVSILDSTQMRLGLLAMINNVQALMEMSSRGQSLVDGLGALRVAEQIDPTPAEQLRLRLAQQEDAALYFDWVNESEVRRQSLNSDPISWNDHQEWFRTKLADPRCRLLVLNAGALPVGQIRFDMEGDEARIDYSLDTIVRGRHWAAKLITMGTRMVQDGLPVMLRAEVKENNQASRAVFTWLGFESAPLPPKGACFRISILSDRSSWLNEYLPELILNWLGAGHRVLWAHSVKDLRAGDFCFYLSCGQIVPPTVLAQFRHNLVVHESDLPQGKGWSPLTWQILEGKNRIAVTLFEAAEKVDSGSIYAQEWLEFKGHELVDELRMAQAETTFALCRKFVYDYPEVLNNARAQVGQTSSYPRRKPSDSRIDPQRSMAEQFNLLRVTDNERYPAFFVQDGCQYAVCLRKMSEEGTQG